MKNILCSKKSDNISMKNVTFKSGMVADGPHGSSIGSQCTEILGRIKPTNERTFDIRSAIGSITSAIT